MQLIASQFARPEALYPSKICSRRRERKKRAREPQSFKAADVFFFFFLTLSFFIALLTSPKKTNCLQPLRYLRIPRLASGQAEPCFKEKKRS